MNTKLYNQQRYRWVKQLSLGEFELNYSRHALDRCIGKNIAKQRAVKIDKNVVEVEQDRETKALVKYLVRFKYSAEEDLTLVLVPESSGVMLVKTCWLNHINDNYNRYLKPKKGERK